MAKSFRKISVPDAATLFDLLDFDASAAHLHMGYARFERDLNHIQDISRTLRWHCKFPRSLGDIWEDLLGCWRFGVVKRTEWTSKARPLQTSISAVCKHSYLMVSHFYLWVSPCSAWLPFGAICCRHHKPHIGTLYRISLPSWPSS